MARVLPDGEKQVFRPRGGDLVRETIDIERINLPVPRLGMEVLLS